MGTMSLFGPFNVPDETYRAWFEKIIALKKANKLNIPAIHSMDPSTGGPSHSELWPRNTGFRDRIPVPELDDVGALPPGDSNYEFPPLISESVFTFIVYGEVTYKDVFNEPRATTFCYYRLPGSMPDSRLKYHACHVFNRVQ